jgi:hypothetical protein
MDDIVFSSFSSGNPFGDLLRMGATTKGFGCRLKWAGNGSCCLFYPFGSFSFEELVLRPCLRGIEEVLLVA